jgi:hypothetical protein
MKNRGTGVPRVLLGIHFAPHKRLREYRHAASGIAAEVVMANETELFFLVLLTLLTLVIHLILSMRNRRHDRHSHS